MELVSKLTYVHSNEIHSSGELELVSSQHSSDYYTTVENIDDTLVETESELNKLSAQIQQKTVNELEVALRDEEIYENIARRSNVINMRDAEAMTDEMKDDVIALLNIFEIPYIVAPYEAEAQCAVLEQVYLAKDAESDIGLSREDFIALSFFLGSDYTEGVSGIGIVNSLEILQTFSMKNADGGPEEGLKNFKKWLDSFDPIECVTEMCKAKNANKSGERKSRKPQGGDESSDFEK
ncbi:unnamed protein product [Sphagnum jensenii]|uniref:XPG-I domain-containing protein n=1 Tax=Sphagnum jensenii TaxID=128206 RepID=A0ABP0VG29_9BRYO